MGDGILEQLEAHLVGWDGVPPPPSEEDRKASEKMLSRAKEVMGSGIDPAAVTQSLKGYEEAVRRDPTHVAAYVGFSRAAMFLAGARPSEAEALLSATLKWVLTSSAKLGKLQESPEIHDLEFKLRDARRKARDRPKAGSAQAVRVNLDRDDEGRVIAQRRKATFRPRSTSLNALIPGRLVDGEETNPIPLWAPVLALVLLSAGLTNVALGNWHYAVNGVLTAVGVLLIGLPVLVWAGEKTRGIAPGFLSVLAVAASVALAGELQHRNDVELPGAQRFGERLNPLYATWRPKLTVGDPIRHAWALSRLAVVEETGTASAPLRADVLHDRLPADLRAPDAAQVLYVVVVRRLQGAAHHMILVWAVAPEDARILARATFTGVSRRILENDALEWITRLRNE